MKKSIKGIKKKGKFPIQTIILCGGAGTRLKEETEYKPKPIVEIGGMPILWHIMKIYAAHQHNNFILALGYKGNVIKDYFLKQKYYEFDFRLNTLGIDNVNFMSDDDLMKENFNIVFAETGLETPHGERVLKLKQYIKGDTFMVTYGDGVADIDINSLLEFHKKQGTIATITGVHPVSRWGLVNSDDDGLVTGFNQKPQLYDYVNGGFMVFNTKVFDYLKPGMFIEDIFPQLAEEKQISMFKHEGFWFGMDTYKDYQTLNEMWKKDPKWKIWQ
jgi:glucose-1-phosphate cytidylyltransferase